MDFNEVAVCDQSPRLVAVCAEGRHKGRQHDDAGVQKQLGHFADATHVLPPVGIGKAQVLAEAVADVVAIQHIGGQAALEQGGVDGIGQGALLVTPLQLSFATSIFASKGKTFYPHVLKNISTPEHSIVNTKTRYETKHQYNPENWKYIVSAMQKVVEYGTGKRFGKLPVPFAAKTGTAQLVKNSGRKHHIKSLSDHSWLIGFVAKKSPDFAITVLVENDNLAILVAKDIIDTYFSQQAEFISMD